MSCTQLNLSLDDDSETSVGVETPSQDVFRNEDVEKATQSTPPGDQQSKALKRRRPPEPEIGSLRPSVMFLSDQDVAKRYAVARTTIWRWTKKLKGFPDSIKIAEGTTRWHIEDLEAYERACGRERTQHNGKGAGK